MMGKDAIALIQERRMRAAATRRSALMRDEVTRLRHQIDALKSTMVEERAKAARQRAEFDAARQEAATAWQEVAAERDRLHAAWRDSVLEHQRLLQSTAWRATAPVRRTMDSIPPGLRRRMRQGLTLAWWALSGQIKVRLQQRRTVLEDARKLRQSCHFCAAWYVAHYPDVATSGLDPALHYVTIGIVEGRDPGPGFSVRAVLERDPTVSRAALLDLLQNNERPGNRRNQPSS